MHFRALCTVLPSAGFNQTMRIMKITAVILLAACLHLSARTYSQKVSLSLTNASLEKAFQEIKAQTGYTFFYTDEQIQHFVAVSINIKNASLKEALDICFKNQPFTYSLLNKMVVVKKKDIAGKDAIEDLKLSPPINFHGRIVDSIGNPISNATVTIKGSNKITSSNTNGEFSFSGIENNAVLIITHIGFQKQEIKLKGESELNIHLSINASQLSDVTVEVSTGYQKIPKERATGSFDLIDNTLINRSVSTNILDRIDNLTPGLQMSRNNNIPQASNNGILIRGMSSLAADRSPLIVIDNFPYDGDLGNINPNDVENLTILKDAAAASIWGARAGNGVIVITTKKGRSGKPQVNLNSNITFQQKPDLFNVSTISSADYIDLETSLYKQSYYAGSFNSPYHVAVTPVVRLLNRVDSGFISSTDAASQIASMRNYDVRNDISKYFYRTMVNQQYFANVSGSTPNLNYYMSAGWDHGLPKPREPTK